MPDTEPSYMHQGYVLGIGSNLDPERNVPRIVERLLRGFGGILLSRFYETEPVGMESDRQFINFCAYVTTGLEADACKAACVAIEVELGRDRAHPSRQTRDRVADIDLLARIGADGGRVPLQPVADYLAGPAAEIVAILSPGQTVPAAQGCVRVVTVGQVQLGKTPTAIDRDDRTGLIVVR